jgi:hypothetical protein
VDMEIDGAGQYGVVGVDTAHIHLRSEGRSHVCCAGCNQHGAARIADDPHYCCRTCLWGVTFAIVTTNVCTACGYTRFLSQ